MHTIKDVVKLPLKHMYLYIYLSIYLYVYIAMYNVLALYSMYSTELVWKVARYTSAAPTFFNELDNYVDGGVLANNPCAKGLTKLQNFYKYERKQKLPISLVVSVGSGKNPDEKLGNVDAHNSFKILFRQLGFSESMNRASNLVLLLSNAVSL